MRKRVLVNSLLPASNTCPRCFSSMALCKWVIETGSVVFARTDELKACVPTSSLGSKPTNRLMVSILAALLSFTGLLHGFCWCFGFCGHVDTSFRGLNKKARRVRLNQRRGGHKKSHYRRGFVAFLLESVVLVNSKNRHIFTVCQSNQYSLAP